MKVSYGSVEGVVSNHDPYSDWAATSMSMNAASSNRKVCHGWRLSGVLYKFVKPASAKRLHSASQHRMHKVSLLTCAIWTSFASVTVLKSGRPRLRGGVRMTMRMITKRGRRTTYDVQPTLSFLKIEGRPDELVLDTRKPKEGQKALLQAH